MQKKSYSVNEAQKALEYYCAYQERCHKEVYHKLEGMNIIPQAIDIIIANLIKDDFLNETRFAKSFTQGKFNIKKWGRYRINKELKQRNISEYNIKKALAEIEPYYINNFEATAKNLCQGITDKNIQVKRHKLAQKLLYRGWESHLVYDKVMELIY